MESLCNFEPVWSRDEAVATPRETIQALHERISQLLLKDGDHLETSEAPTIDDIVRASLHAIEVLLRDNLEDNNIILKRLRQIGAIHHDRSAPIKNAIYQWYRSAVPAVTRDPSAGLALEGDFEDDIPGIARDVWDRDSAAEQFFNGNMGLIAMLMSSETWAAPRDPRLFRISLCANATTSLLYAAYMIISANSEEVSQRHDPSAAQVSESFRLYIRSAWLLAREGQIQTPGQHYSATMDEVKMSSDGKRLLSKIGRAEWSEAPLWHPVRNVPGSPWNKFIRNTGQKMFSRPGDDKSPTKFQVPSSALTLIEPWEQYYSDIRSRIDQTGRQRITCTTGQAHRQFAELSQRSGLTYNNRSLSEMDALHADDINQVYAYHLPMVKKAITDARGDLTMPFLTTAGRALRFEEDPQELEADFFVMTFGA